MNGTSRITDNQIHQLVDVQLLKTQIPDKWIDQTKSSGLTTSQQEKNQVQINLTKDEDKTNSKTEICTWNTKLNRQLSIETGNRLLARPPIRKNITHLQQLSEIDDKPVEREGSKISNLLTKNHPQI